MTDFDFDHELRQALRDSPDGASPDFTQRVVAELGEQPPARPWLPRPAFAAAVVLAMLGGIAGLMASRQPTVPELATSAVGNTQREELLREYQALQSELDQIRQMAGEQTPVLYLGGDENFDLMYDLADYRPERTPNGMQPASLPDRG